MLEDDEAGGEPDHASLMMMMQAMIFMMNAFQTLKVETPLEDDNGRAFPIATTLDTLMIAAAGAALKGATRVASAAGAAPARVNSQKIPLLGKVLWGSPTTGVLSGPCPDLQEYGPKILTEGAKVRSVTLGLGGTAAYWMVMLHNKKYL